MLGIGASAAAPDSLERLLSSLLPNSDLVVAVVLQQREALRESWADEFSARSGVKILPAADGLPVQAGEVYLCRADTITAIRDGVLTVRPAEQPPGERGTIDSFLVSLAQGYAQKAVGVVLADINGDGTLGVAALKENGGLAIAEQPGNGWEHLGEGHTPAAIADFVLPIDEIGPRVVGHLRNLHRLEEQQGFEAFLARASGALSRVAEVLRNKTGNDFHGYKQNTFLRRVQRRMQVVQINDISAYVEFLRSDKDEAQKLFNDLLIGVTQFFRDKREFDILESEVIPKLFQGKHAGDSVRIWVLGCATGEEAYSIGILLREHMAKLESVPQVQIFATDLDGRALATARVGRYRTTIENDLTPERLARWFVREGDTYCVVRELREMCIFSQHNVLKDAPFSRLDLVSCRNLLIYLNAELQNRVIPLFHFALLPERYLFLGNSENVTRHPKLFAPIDRRARIFKRLDAVTRVPPEFPITAMARAVLDPAPLRPRLPDVGLERRAQRVAERYAPAYVITDEQFQVLNFSGRMGRYLEPSAGTATLDLLNLVHRDLRLELRAALNRALERNEPAQAELVQVALNGDRMLVDVTVEVLHDQPSGQRALIAIFKDAPVRPEDARNFKDTNLVRSEHVERLEAELRSTHDRLQSTIEELESTNEELKSSNEEYQSLNEELQSANEELETSREELQSVNEELTTVNGELHHRVQELTRATSDLKNFLESTQIATIFLDNDLKVMNFTPAVAHVFHLVETDIGRPIAHIKAKIPTEDLFDDARHVIRTLASMEREVTASETGTRYIARILPYRSVENYIAGTVITFVDVTAVTRAEERTRMLLDELQHRVRNTLGVVRSIVRRTADTSTSVEDYATHLDGRLNAFARTQALVTRDPEAGVDLEYLVADELLAYRAQEPEQVRIMGPAMRLQPKAAEMLGLAVHELATNAVKYGALSLPTGRIEVSCSIERGNTPELLLVWREFGGPSIKQAPENQGFGTELLERTLAFELKARTVLAYEANGLVCSITIPLTTRTVMPSWQAPS